MLGVTDAIRAKAMAEYDIVVAAHGTRDFLNPRRPPLHELISTILSQRTTHADEETAYQRMWARFPSWEAIRDAPDDELADAISTSRYPEVKAPQIKLVIARVIEERGAPNIDFLKDLPADEGMKWLMSLPGVGLKTASLVLLFNFAKPVIPVDTHVHRVSQRVGIIGPKVTAEKAHLLLLEILPNDPLILYNFHVGNLRHGQKICIFTNPRCHICPAQSICDYYQIRRKNAAQ